DIKQRFKQQALTLWQQIDEQLMQDNQEYISALKQELDKHNNQLHQLKEKETLQQALQDKKEYLKEVFQNPELVKPKHLLDDLLQKKQSFTGLQENVDSMSNMSEPKLESTEESITT